MKSFCSSRQFLFFEGCEFRSVAVRFLAHRLKYTKLSAVEVTALEKKVKDYEWKHGQGIFLNIGGERWSLVCNKSLLPHLEARFDYLSSRDLPMFQAEDLDPRPGTIIQTEQGVAGDAFFCFFLLKVIGQQADLKIRGLWEESNFDISEIEMSRGSLREVMASSDDVDADGMLKGTVPKERLSALLDGMSNRLRVDARVASSFERFLKYLKISVGSDKKLNLMR